MPIEFIIMDIPGISSSQLHGCIWIAYLLWRAVVQVSIVFLCFIDACITIFVAVWYAFYIFATSDLSCVIMLTLQWHSSDGFFLSHGVYLGFPYPCCQSRFLYLLGSFSQVPLAIGLHCWVLHSWRTMYPFLTCRRLVPRLTPDTSVSTYICSCCRTP